MGFLDKLFSRFAPKNTTYAKTLDGYPPVFGQYGTNVYAFDVVQQALKCIVDEFKKVKPLHVRYSGADPVPVKSTVQDVLENPNPLMTSTDFLEKCAWLLLLNYNLFIIPTYYTWIDEKTGVERRYYESLYPIKPMEADFIEDASGRLFVKFWFYNGENTIIPYDDVIHVRYNYSVNDYMGGDEYGQPDNRAILETVNLNKQLLTGIAKAMNASYTVNAVVKFNTILDDGKTEAAIAKLEQHLKNNESGFLPLDLKSEYIPIPKNTALVDAESLKFVDSKILRNWGIPLAILTGDYSKEQYEAFYQKSIEPLINAFRQAFTKALFTRREKAFGNRVEFYPEDLIFLTTGQKIELVNMLAPTGALMENEKRTMFGLLPLPELEGKRYMSLNWIDANNAAQYQVGANVNVDVIDEEKEGI